MNVWPHNTILTIENKIKNELKRLVVVKKINKMIAQIQYVAKIYYNKFDLATNLNFIYH